MSSFRPILVLMALASIATPASASVLVVPLPGLQGTYTSVPPTAGNFERTVQVQLPVLPSVIYSVSLRTKGTCAFANYSCDGSQGYGPPHPVAVNISASIYEGDILTTQQWAEFDGYLGAPGAFDQTKSLAHYPAPTDWTFLLDGVANLTLDATGEPAIMECNLVGPPDQTTFDSVELLVDGEFPTPAATTSWGALKSIYR